MSACLILKRSLNCQIEFIDGNNMHEDLPKYYFIDYLNNSYFPYFGYF